MQKYVNHFYFYLLSYRTYNQSSLFKINKILLIPIKDPLPILLMPIYKTPPKPRFQVDQIYFSLKLIKALIPIKFKCRFLVELKTYSTTVNLKTLGKSKDHYRATNSIILFDKDQSLNFDSYMIFDNDLNRYKKKQIQIIVNLISDNRGDQIKLVGRIRLDLNQFMIDNRGETMKKQLELENCSVKKPEVAKLQFQFKLIKQAKVNLSTNPNKQQIFPEIQKGLFADALEYNQFTKEIFGKDMPNLNMSKINKSINENSKINMSINQNQSQKQIKNTSTKQITKPSTNETTASLNKSIEASNKKVNGSDKILQMDKSLSSSVKKSNQQIEKSELQYVPQTLKKTSMQSAKKVVSPRVARQNGQSPQKRKNISSKKVIPASPQGAAQVHKQTEQRQLNPLTQSMFDQQQLVIESLQQQLQQANEIIEQYKFELDLLKQQTDRLQKDKQSHYHQMQQSRARNNILNKNMQQKQDIIINNESQKQLIKLQAQLQQYRKVFTQKQQIIKQKDLIIQTLQSNIQYVTNQFEQKLIQKDQIYNELNEQYLLISQQQNYNKRYIQQFKQKFIKKQQYTVELQLMIDDLKHSVESLNDMIKNNNLIELNQKLNKKQQQISQLQRTIQNQKSIYQQSLLKISDLQYNIKSLNKVIEDNQSKITFSQSNAKKYQDIKQKAQQEMHKAIEKAKLIEKDKYLLNQQITKMNLQTKSIEKLVEQKVLSYKNKYDQLQMAYKQSQNKIAQLKFAVQSYQSTLEEQQNKNISQVDQLTKKLQNFNKKQHLLRQSLDLLENQTSKIRNFVQEKQTRILQCEELIGLKDQEIVQKNDKINYLERKQRMAENTIEDFKTQIKMLQAMAGQSLQDRPNHRDGQQELQTRLFIISQSNMQLLQKQKLQSELLDQKDNQIHQLLKIVNSVDPLKREIKALEDKVLIYQKKNIDLREQIKNLTKQSIDQRSKLQQQGSQLQHAYSQCEQFQQRLKTVEDQKIILCNQFQQKQLQVLHFQSQQQILKSNIKILQKQLQDKQLELIEAKSFLEQFEKSHQELTKKITSIQSSAHEFTKKQQALTNSRVNKQKQPISAIKQPSDLQINSSRRNSRSKQQEEIYRLNEQLQNYKQREQSYMCNVLDLQQQLQKVKKQKSSLSSSINEQKNSVRKTQPIQGMSHFDKKDLKIACDQLQKLIQNRIKNRETQNLIQMIVSNSQLLGGSQSRTTNEEGNLISKQKNNLQQKSRILSRQVQKIKSLIFKKSELSYKDKTEMIGLLKPCENITNELIKIVQNFAKENDEQNYSQA